MPETRLTFRPRHRLTHARQFQGVYKARVQRAAGPLVVFARPNEMGHARLGLSVGARVGGAVKRNRIKRRLREAFRLGQGALPLRAGEEARGFDYVINVRPHEPLAVEEYGRLLRELAVQLAGDWERRSARDAAKGGEGEP